MKQKFRSMFHYSNYYIYVCHLYEWTQVYYWLHYRMLQLFISQHYLSSWEHLAWLISNLEHIFRVIVPASQVANSAHMWQLLGSETKRWTEAMFSALKVNQTIVENGIAQKWNKTTLSRVQFNQLFYMENLCT